MEHPSKPAVKRQQAPAANQELKAARESRGGAVGESPGTEVFENREEPFRIGFVGVGLFVVTSFSLFRRGPLAVIGTGSVFAKKVFIKQCALHRF